MNDYLAFLEKKQKTHVYSGFDIDESELNSNLFPFQRFIVKRALKAGKYAIFADCGLGKTLMQLEWANQVVRKTNKPALILCPLAVSKQTIQEGEKFGIKVSKFPTNGTLDLANQIYISNYEQLDNIDCAIFSGVVLDESSILKNFTGVYKNKIIDSFSHTNFKLSCTAW
jgi:reverse gyrase